MKKILVTFSLAVILASAFLPATNAQTISTADKKKLSIKEDSLAALSETLIMDSSTAGRMIADSLFIRILVRSLQVRNSFYYPFDSVQGISKLYAPDTSFRIFTWNIQYDEYYSRQRGAIQMRTADGSLKLIPLRDNSEFTANPMDSVRNMTNWIGAVYYNMIRTQFRGKNYYTLFGHDANSAMSSKKWIEVLTFNAAHEPQFGGPLFSFEKDSIPSPVQFRFSIEYKKNTRVLVNYIDELGMILVDHLVSESNEPDHKWTLVPDGFNEAFKWVNGKWIHVDEAFNYKIDMKGADMYLGKPPVGDPLFDKKGTKDEKKLQDKTDQNKKKIRDEKGKLSGSLQ